MEELEQTTNKTEDTANVDHWLRKRGRWSRLIEQFALWMERPINKFSNTAQLNPFYHTGTIAVFLLVVVAFSGFYLFIFFQYGFDASYAAATRLEGQPIGRFMRALHRYASGALLITTLLHAVRMLFMERFRGPRWLAWVTGVIMTAFIWGAGVTGYWLLWDERAQLITDQFSNFLTNFTSRTAAFTALLVRAETTRSWPILFTILAVHILLFIITVIFFLYHIRRLNRAKWLPEVPWLVGMGVVLLIGSAAFPVGMLPAANAFQIPAEITLDPLFLFFLPFGGTAAWVLWGVLLVIGVILAILPWIPTRQPEPPRVNIIDENCTGCTRCAVDCPYKAIEIIERPEGSEYKYLAVADPAMCVSCGICLGSCLDNAITLGDSAPDILWDVVKQRIQLAQAKADHPEDVEIVFTCERHANQSAKPYLEQRIQGVVATHENVEVIAVPCAGAVPPDLLTYALEEGAAEVRIVGCPPDDCANREGNRWEEQRLTRERVPKLRRRYANVPISAVWLAPDEFEQGLAVDVYAEETNWLETRRMLSTLNWRNFVPAFTMLAIVMLIQILSSDLIYRSPAAQEARIQVVLTDVGEPFTYFGYGDAISKPDGTLRLNVELDGQLVSTESFESSRLDPADPQIFVWEQVVEPDTFAVKVYWVHESSGAIFDIYDQQLELDAGQVARVTQEQ